MAFGKKKDDAAAEAETEPVDDLTPEEDTAATDESPDTSVDPALEDAAEEPAAEPAAAAPAAGTDALLSMFQESKVAAEDLSILTDLAGDADIDDILEELRTLRAALGITDAYEEDEDFAAAA
jgi:hypothetical protein